MLFILSDIGDKKLLTKEVLFKGVSYLVMAVWSKALIASPKGLIILPLFFLLWGLPKLKEYYNKK